MRRYVVKVGARQYVCTINNTCLTRSIYQADLYKSVAAADNAKLLTDKVVPVNVTIEEAK
jgi:hypothetical protein